MAHVSKFLHSVNGEGCYAINATTDSGELSVLAFARNDGATVVVVLNNSSKATAVDVVIDGRKISYDIPSQSLVTFVSYATSQPA